MDPKQITDLLVQSGCLTPQTAENLVAQALLNRDRIDKVIFDQKFLTPEEFYLGLAKALNLDYYDLLNFEPSPETLQLIPAQLARVQGILPLFSHANLLFVALVDPCNFKALEDLRFAFEGHFEQVLAEVDRVHALINSYYGSEETNLDFWQSSQKSHLTENQKPKTENSFLSEASPIIQFVDLILEKAVQSRASDIHLEPFEAEFKIRYRVDGTLYEVAGPPASLSSAIISHIKVLAHLDIAERRVPQDGRIQCIKEGRTIDFRVSTLPTAFGESVVLRVLDPTTVQLDLEMLGMSEEVMHLVLKTIHKPHGIFILTGPTGSGKTTTLYSCLRKINCIDSKLLTVEDPVEYEMEGILQVSINENIGLSFATALRSFLRQDPDCIMVGEIRDRETAEIAIQASLTGHLVFTTLHTNDTIGAITRLENLGIEPFLISASCEGILAQRLIRRICPQCRTDYPATASEISSFGLEKKNLSRGAGCNLCHATGYLGRKGIFEFLPLTNPIREQINNRASEALLRKKAAELGMVRLRSEGLRCVSAGDSTLEEILKYT